VRTFITGVVLFFSFILQTTLIQYMELWGVKPNLMLIIIICFSLLRGSVGGAVIGLFSGILMDFFAAEVFGLHSLLCMYTGVVTGSLSSRFVRENYLVAVLFTFVLSFVY